MAREKTNSELSRTACNRHKTKKNVLEEPAQIFLLAEVPYWQSKV